MHSSSVIVRVTAGNFGTGAINSGVPSTGGAGGAGSIEIEYWSN